MLKRYIILIFIIIGISIFGENLQIPYKLQKFPTIEELKIIIPPTRSEDGYIVPQYLIEEIWERDHPSGFFKWIGEQFIKIDTFIMKEIFKDKTHKRIIKHRAKKLKKILSNVHDNGKKISFLYKWKYFLRIVFLMSPDEREQLNLSEYHTKVLIRLKYLKEKNDVIYQQYLDEFLLNISIWDYYYAYKDAIEEFEAKDYEDAADYLDDALLYTTGNYEDSVKALHFLIVCYQKLNWKHSEFLTWERLLNNYPYFTDYYEGVKREFKCGAAYKEGYREPAFATSWLTWLTGNDKTIEIYESTIQRAPFAIETAQAKILLARKYLDDSNDLASQKILREVITQFKGTKEEQVAYLLLGDILLQLSQIGDGDGVNGRKALRVLNEFKEKYPKHKNIDWVDDALRQILDHLGKHLYEIAYFYYHREKEIGAKLYAEKIINEYPESRYKKPAENMLAYINKSDFDNYEKEYVRKYTFIPIEDMKEYKVKQIPVLKQEVLDTPNEGKWLIPPKNVNKTEKDTLNNYKKYIIQKP